MINLRPRHYVSNCSHSQHIVELLSSQEFHLKKRHEKHFFRYDAFFSVIALQHTLLINMVPDVYVTSFT